MKGLSSVDSHILFYVGVLGELLRAVRGDEGLLSGVVISLGFHVSQLAE